ncbi:MAG: FTR1 family protein [Nitrososphaerales archaeon]
MFAEFLISLREGFEAALIVSIVLAYLKRTGNIFLLKYVWYGAISALMVSLTLGTSIWISYGVLPKVTQVLFEGIAAWIAVFVLSSMIYWMALKGKGIKAEIEEKVKILAKKGTILGLLGFSFVVVFREGVETVLFLTPFFIKTPFNSSIGTFAGTLVAVAVAYTIFILGIRLNLKRFFYFTSILIILLAGGLAGYGTHELIEYAEQIGIDLGWAAKSAFSLPISQDSLLHHKNVIGSILAVMFGYTVKAEWLRIIIHLSYLSLVLPLVIKVYRKG